MSAINVAKAAGLNAVKMGLSFGAFDATISVSVAAFGGAASPTSGTLHNPTGQTAQSQSSGAKPQSSFSLVGNYTPSEYLNVGVSGASFRRGRNERGKKFCLFRDLLKYRICFV